MNPRVLMLGWEFPPYTSGGLGVATQSLFEALLDKVSLKLVIPQQPANDAMGVEHIFDLHTTPVSLPPVMGIPQLVAIPQVQSISPYPPYSPVPLTSPKSASSSFDLYGPMFHQALETYAQKAIHAAESLEFDLIHAHDWMTIRSALALKARTQKPLILHVHSLEYDRSGPGSRGPIFELEQMGLREADHIIAVSDYTKSVISQVYGIHPDRISVVHNGIRLVEPYRSPRPFPEKLVLFLGRITQQKGPMTFLSIAEQVLKEIPHLRFVMAGKGELLPEVIEQAAARELGDRVHFTGFIEQQQVFDLFSMADIFVMPSVSEPFGLVALEAAQFGIPCVLGMPSGVSEVLPHAMKAPYDDVDALASRIIDLIRHPEVAEMIQQRTYEDLKQLSWGAAADKITAIYQAVW